MDEGAKKAFESLRKMIKEGGDAKADNWHETELNYIMQRRDIVDSRGGLS